MKSLVREKVCHHLLKAMELALTKNSRYIFLKVFILKVFSYLLQEATSVYKKISMAKVT